MTREATATGDLAGFARMVRDRLGLDFTQRRRGDLQRCVRQMQVEGGLEELSVLLRRLADPVEADDLWPRIAGYLTVVETHFFREPGTMAVLRDEILPELIRRARLRGRVLRLWSAGCGTGEEPFTLAILLRQILPDHDDWQISIVGTDISQWALDAARRAVYRRWAFRGTAPWLRKLYFDEEGAGTYALREPYRSAVRFRIHNLNGDDWSSPSLASMDLILCRNVLMYFAPDCVRRTVEHLRGALAPGGYLVTSPSELAIDTFEGLHSARFEEGFAFRRADTAAAPAPAPRPTPQRRSPPARKGPAAAPCAPAGPQEQGEPWAAAARVIHTLADRGRNEEALIATTQAVAEFPMSAEIHYLHAVILESFGRVDEAERELRRALYLDPDSVLAHYMRGHLLDRLGRCEGALRHLRTASRIADQLEESRPVAFGNGLDGATVRRMVALRLARVRTDG